MFSAARLARRDWFREAIYLHSTCERRRRRSGLIDQLPVVRGKTQQTLFYLISGLVDAFSAFPRNGKAVVLQGGTSTNLTCFS